MREIKFRAWDIHRKVMIKPDHDDPVAEKYGIMIDIQGGMDITWHGKKPSDPKTRWWCEKAKDYILMQYTGLEDRNGMRRRRLECCFRGSQNIGCRNHSSPGWAFCSRDGRGPRAASRSSEDIFWKRRRVASRSSGDILWNRWRIASRSSGGMFWKR